MEVTIGLLIPFIGTVLGSFMVYFLKENLNRQLEIIILGFAAGVMMAASIWSLIIPAIEMVEKISWLPAVIGLSIGIITFYFIDIFLSKYKKHRNKDKTKKLMLAVTLHNIPEGMAVGIAFAGYLAKSPGITLASCFALSIGVAVQNFPEGSIISLPMKKEGYSKNKSFFYGVISAVFELLGGIITLFFANAVSIILPYFLTFAAGAMIYVIIVELIPESNDKTNLNTIGFLIGFIIMMILDITLG